MSVYDSLEKALEDEEWETSFFYKEVRFILRKQNGYYRGSSYDDDWQDFKHYRLIYMIFGDKSVKLFLYTEDLKRLGKIHNNGMVSFSLPKQEIISKLTHLMNEFINYHESLLFT